MAAGVVLFAVLATYLAQVMAADLQKFRSNFVNVDRMWEDNTNVYFENVHGVPTNIYTVGMCNPNLARPTNRNISLPKQPQKLQYPRCLPFGPTGFAINSVAIYHPLAGGNVNAVEGATAEGFDICGAHADPTESYHYHKIPEKHLSPYETQNNAHAPHQHLCPYEPGQIDKIIGVGYDGFLLYGPLVTIRGQVYDFRNTNNPATGVSLDECHGIEIDAEGGGYAYIANLVYPYMMGCFRGAPFRGSTYECLTIKQGELCDCCQGLLTRDDVTEEEEDPCPYTCVYDDTGEFGNLPPPTQNIVSNQGNEQNNAGNQGDRQNNGNRWRKTEPFPPGAMLRQMGQPRSSLLDLFQPRGRNMNSPLRNPMWYSFNRQVVEQNIPPLQPAVSGTFIPSEGDNDVDVGLSVDSDDEDDDDGGENHNDNVNAEIPDRCRIPPGGGGGGGGGPPKKGPPPGGWGDDGPPPKKDEDCPYTGMRPIAQRRKRQVLENLVKKLAAFN